MANSLLVKSLRVFHQSISPIFLLQPTRTTTTKHFNPKFKKLRALKVQKVKLPYFDESAEISKEKMRAKMKEKGLFPPRPWMERPIYISSTGGVFEPYVPPEGDGKMSSVTPAGAKQKLQFLEKKSKSMMAIRKIKSFEDEFDTDRFCEEAQNVYINAHNALNTKDMSLLREYVTERAYPEFKHNTMGKTIRWKFLKSLEPPRLVHARCTDVVSKENIFGQVTVRFHTQQQLAIYDRFGRLMHGSEIIAKDVIEYIVFEKHLSNVYGKWRLHDKIIPDWMPEREPIEKTFALADEVEEAVSTDEISTEVTTVKQDDSSKPQPDLATA